jgi:lipopolysaccharide export LptBFGC system permease protein LptF
MAHRKGYIFTNKKHSQKAIMSTILGIISTVSLAAVLYLTYLRKGNAPTGYGVTGLLIALFSLAGLILGMVTVVEKDRYKFFPCVGIFLNFIALFGIGVVLYAGI